MSRPVCGPMAVLGAVPLLAGCSGAATAPSGVVTGPSAVATNAAGVVSGTLAWVGGPLPAPPAPTPSPTPTSGMITLSSAVGQTFTTAAGKDGEFSLGVPAGSYIVTGTSAVSGPAECEADGSVTVVAGQTVTVQVFCPVP